MQGNQILNSPDESLKRFFLKPGSKVSPDKVGMNTEQISFVFVCVD